MPKFIFSNKGKQYIPKGQFKFSSAKNSVDPESKFFQIIKGKQYMP